MILKYSSKRHSYTPPVYRARNLVAALDHNTNCDIESAKRKDGSLRFVFSKGFTHFVNSQKLLFLTIGRTVKYMIKQIEFYTLDNSVTIVKKKWSMVCLPSATGKAVPICSRYFETVRTVQNHLPCVHE